MPRPFDVQAVDEFEKTHLVTCKISEFFANLFVAKQEGELVVQAKLPLL
jgi:hypothetical protein